MTKKSNKYTSVIDRDQGGKFGLGRPFYFDNWNNRIAVLLSLIATIAVLTLKQVTGTATGSVLNDGVNYGVAFFFSYLIAQELDPEPGRELGGILAGILSLVACLAMGTSQDSVVALLWMLFMVRMFNRTSGSRHRIGDNVIMIVAALFLGKQGFWLVPVVTGLGYILESQITDGYQKSLYLGGLAFATCIFVDRPTGVVPLLDVTYVYLMGVALVLFLPEFTAARITKAKGDRDNRVISFRRLQTGQAFFVLSTFLIIWFGGNEAAVLMLPCVMTAIGCGVWLLFWLMMKKVFNKGEDTEA